MMRILNRLRRMFASLGSLLKEAINGAWAHNIGRMAASIAYFGAFSLAPIIVIMTTLASLVLGKRATEGLIAERLASTFGTETARFIQSMIAAIHASTGLTLATVLAVILLLWASSRIIGSVRGALNDIWGVTGHGGGGWLGFLIGKLIDLATVAGIGFMFLLAMLVNTAITAMTTYFSQFLPVPGWLLQVLGVLFSLVVTIVFLAIIFRVLPNIKVRLRYILVGASLTGVLFTVGNYVIGQYLGRTSPGSAFGAAGSLAVIMIWIYYVAYIIIFGAEITRAYAYRAGMKRVRAAVETATSAEAPANRQATATPAEPPRAEGSATIEPPPERATESKAARREGEAGHRPERRSGDKPESR